MADFDSLLNRWQSAGVLDSATAAQIRAWESRQIKPMGLRWQGLVALILGAILLACGVVLFVSAHWDKIGPGWRFALVLAMVAAFHLAGGLARSRFRSLSTALHAVGTVSTGAAIALVGQIFNIQEHWPAAVLLWAVAALAGWILLGDEAQQVLTLLLVPAWIFAEFAFAAENHIGGEVYLARFLLVWAVLYLTFFLGSKREIAQGILFACAAVAAVAGVVVLLVVGWTPIPGNATYLSLGLRTWGWVCIAVLPLLLAVFKFRKSVIPVATALVLSIALPWCQHVWTETYTYGNGNRASHVQTEPNLAAHVLVAAFAVFIIWWGVRQTSKSLVNLGILYFAGAVGWFYFSDVFDKVGRSLGLIGLGVLFLAGGWALEKMRRSLLAGMDADAAKEEL
jgi:uncharacterized membrane protein